MPEAGRRIDVLRRTGPLLVAAGTTVELLSYQVPTDIDAELAAIGTDCVPASGADSLQFRVYNEQTPSPDYLDVQTQPGTVPIPYLAREPIGRGRTFRLLVTNTDPANSYRVNARAVLECVS